MDENEQLQELNREEAEYYIGGEHSRRTINKYLQCKYF
jgi:hypothetical protein